MSTLVDSSVPGVNIGLINRCVSCDLYDVYTNIDLVMTICKQWPICDVYTHLEYVMISRVTRGLVGDVADLSGLAHRVDEHGVPLLFPGQYGSVHDFSGLKTHRKHNNE